MKGAELSSRNRDFALADDLIMLMDFCAFWSAIEIPHRSDIDR